MAEPVILDDMTCMIITDKSLYGHRCGVDQFQELCRRCQLSTVDAGAVRASEFAIISD
jgi:hypothetical protein